MILVIDNFDSFTFNIVQYLGQLGEKLEVVRSDAITVEAAQAMQPDFLIISPGPCSPGESGQSIPLLKAFAGEIPVLGVCLGMQCIGEAYGGRVVRADRLMHGKTSPIHHRYSGLFAGLPNPFAATRYHSLIVERESLPDCLEVTAETAEGEIMGLRHRELEVSGVQFHPESLATEAGIRIFENFLGRQPRAAAGVSVS